MLKSLIFLTTLLALSECAKIKSFKILAQPSKEIEVTIGQPISVVCAATGNSMSDPIIYWKKGIGARHDEDGERISVTAVGKSVLYIAESTVDDIASYKCVIEDLCTGDSEEIPFDFHVPDDTCKEVYGLGHQVYGVTWQFKNWTEAVQDCKDKGLEIALPTSDEENNQLFEDIKGSFDHHPNARKFAHENWVWIGANDMEEEGVWRSTLDGELMSDVYDGDLPWAKNQPDNLKRKDEVQNVAGISRIEGRWDDSFEHYPRPYACKCQ